MASLWLVSRASRRFLKPSHSFSRTLFAVSSTYQLTTNSKNPNPNPYPNATLLGPFTQGHRWTPSCVEFDLRLLAHISSSSSSTGAKNYGNRASNDAKVEVEASWIDLYLPRQARPYAKLARLNRPIGTWLLAWPCMW